MILILRKHKVGIQITAEKLEKKHGGYYWKLGTIWLFSYTNLDKKVTN